MHITRADEVRVIALLENDVGVTLGERYAAMIRHEANSRREFANEPDVVPLETVQEYEEIVAENVQQEFHDTFVDTTWPRCPLHERHPLWLHNGVWTCEALGVPVARLGALRANHESQGEYRILLNEPQSPTG